jgi:hypothetical protein
MERWAGLRSFHAMNYQLVFFLIKTPVLCLTAGFSHRAPSRHSSPFAIVVVVDIDRNTLTFSEK